MSLWLSIIIGFVVFYAVFRFGVMMVIALLPQTRKKIVVLMGASGSGKSTLANALKEQGIPEIISHTTRAMRPGEVEGVTYYYVSKEEFDRIEKIEEVEYSGNHYCISKPEVDNKLKKHNVLYVICDRNGMEQLKAIYQDKVVVVYISIPMELMAERMRSRGDSEEQIQKRLQYAIDTDELSNAKYADYTIVNDNLEKAKQELIEIAKRKK